LSPVKKPKLTDSSKDRTLVAEENLKFAIKPQASTVINSNDPNKTATVMKIEDGEKNK
jgi:hypothetical protein